MRIRLLFNNFRRSKLPKRGALILLPLLLSAIALTVVAGKSDKAPSPETALPNVAPRITAAAIADGYSTAGEAHWDSYAYVPEPGAFFNGPTSSSTDEAAAPPTFADPAHPAEEILGSEDNLGLSEFLEARVEPVSTLYGATYRPTTGLGALHTNTIPIQGSGGGGIVPDLNAAGGAKNQDPLDPLGIADIPGNTGVGGADQPTSVPEPETWALWLIGLTGCYFSRRRSTITTN